MNELLICFPDDLDFDDQELIAFIAAKLYGNRRLSLGEAAKIARVEKWDFHSVLTKFDVPYFTLAPEELTQDVENSRRYHN